LLTCEVKMIQPLRHMPILSTSLLTCEVKMIQPLRHSPILLILLRIIKLILLRIIKRNNSYKIGLCRKG
jgi:hypothetical protein